MDNIASMLLEYLPGIIQTLAWGVIGWVWWTLKRVFVRHEELQALREDMDDLFAKTRSRFDDLESAQQDRSLAQEQLKQTLDLLPTARDMQSMMVSLKEMEGDIKGMAGKIDGLSHATSRLERTMDLFTESHIGGGR